jgi:hypothetical protein
MGVWNCVTKFGLEVVEDSGMGKEVVSDDC